MSVMGGFSVQPQLICKLVAKISYRTVKKPEFKTGVTANKRGSRYE
jgi:hypothetical protein